MHRKAFLALVAVCCLAAPAWATITIDFGNWTLAAEQAGQSLDFLSSQPIATTMTGDGDGGLTAIDFNLIIEDGTFGPQIEDINLGVEGGSGTIWAGISSPPTSQNAYPTRDQAAGVATIDPNVTPNSGVVAFLSFSTLGVPLGVYNMSWFSNALGFPLDALGAADPQQEVLFVTGTLTVIPEPSSVILAMVGAAGLGIVALRRRRRKAA